MKNLISLLLAATLIAFAVFAINYWFLGFDLAESKALGLAAGVTGVAIEYLRPSIAHFSKRLEPTHKKLTKR